VECFRLGPAFAGVVLLAYLSLLFQDKGEFLGGFEERNEF